jgi:hypothetical protein
VTTPCSTWCRELHEPLGGTAVVAPGWLVLEQPGPWGAKAPRQSHLDPDFGGRIDKAAKDAGVRFGLIRTPGRHADTHHPEERQVYAACTTPRRTWLLAGRVHDPTELGAIDLHALAAGDRDAVMASVPVLEPTDEPVLLVCTNAKRDECCALYGRPVALALAPRAPGRVWESNHLGGHRFAPTVAVLPSGMMHGQVDVDTAGIILTAAADGHAVLSGLRGRSAWTKPGQVAEIAVRESIDEDRLDVLSVTGQSVTVDGHEMTVGHIDGRVWTVRVIAATADPPRPESCGKEPYDMTILTAAGITEAPQSSHDA